jgi:hypothetical protein
MQHGFNMRFTHPVTDSSFISFKISELLGLHFLSYEMGTIIAPLIISLEICELKNFSNWKKM